MQRKAHPATTIGKTTAASITPAPAAPAAPTVTPAAPAAPAAPTTVSLPPSTRQ